MRSLRPRSRAARLAMFAVALLAVAAVSAGIARSTASEPIPDANGVIHACYKKPIGPIRIVYNETNCSRGELPLEWNQAGVQGPQGEMGPQGPQGPQGPPGAAADAEVVTAAATGVPFALDHVTERGTFVALDRPGTYWVMATGTILGPDTDSACSLRVLGELIADSTIVQTSAGNIYNAYPPHEDFTLTGVVEITQPGQAVLAYCLKVGGVPSLRRLRLVALKIT